MDEERLFYIDALNDQQELTCEDVRGLIGEVRNLNAWRKTAIAAADGILAPLTMEYGRLMEENPDYEMVVSFGEYAVSLPASKFMALYRATDT